MYNKIVYKVISIQYLLSGLPLVNNIGEADTLDKAIKLVHPQGAHQHIIIEVDINGQEWIVYVQPKNN